MMYIVQFAVTNMVFIVFLLLYVNIPGLLLFQLIKKDKRVISADTILISFFFGLGMLILEFLLFSMLGMRILFILLSPILSAVFLYLNLKELRRDKMNLRLSGLNIQFALILITVSILTCLTQRYAFIQLDNCDSIYLYQDITWHIGNVVSMSRGFPFYDLRFAELKFNYHYFNDLIFGMCKYCFGMNATALLLRCTPLLAIYTFSLGTYAFFKRISEKALIGFVMFVCSGATITYYVLNTEKMDSLLNYHIFSNINGVAVSLAAVISVCLFYSDMYRDKEMKIGDLLILAVLMFVATGLKGPFTAVIVPAMVITSILIFLYDKNYKRMIAVSAVTGLSFLATYIVIIKGVENLSKQSNNNRATELSIIKTFSKSRIWENFSNLLDYGDRGHMLLYCLCMALIGSTIAVGVYFLFFTGRTALTLWEMLKYRKKQSAEILVAILSGWIGLAAFWYVSHVGFSQAYFLFAAVLFIVGVGSSLLNNAMGKKAGVLLAAIVVANTSVWGYFYTMSLIDMQHNDAEHFRVNEPEHNSGNVQDLTRNEILGLVWLRDNTDNKSTVATDRIDLWSPEYPTSDKDCRCFYYSAFSERQIYIEGYSYSDISADAVEERLINNKRIYSADWKTARETAEESGVDYVIVTKRFNDTRPEFGKPVYSNQGIAIYETAK